MEATMQTATQANVQLIQRCYQFFAEGNIPALLNELTDDVKWISPGPKQIPWAGNYDGKQGVAQFFTLVGQNVVFQVFEPREFIAQGNKVITLGHLQGTSNKTGKTGKEEWAMAFTIRDGKVSHFQEYVDTWQTADLFS